MSTRSNSSVTIDEEAFVKSLEVRYHPIIKFYNYAFFGNGELSFVPIFWVVTIFGIYIGEMTSTTYILSPWLVIYQICMMLEMFANVYFGYAFCKTHHLARMILFHEQKYGLDSNLALKHYNTASFIFLFLLSYMIIFNVVLEIPADETLDVAGLILGSFETIMIDFLVLGASLYLCIIWCMQVWVVHHSGMHFFEELITLTGNDDDVNSEEEEEEAETTLNALVHDPSAAPEITNRMKSFHENKKSLIKRNSALIRSAISSSGQDIKITNYLEAKALSKVTKQHTKVQKALGLTTTTNQKVMNKVVEGIEEETDVENPSTTHTADRKSIPLLAQRKTLTMTSPTPNKEEVDVTKPVDELSLIYPQQFIERELMCYLRNMRALSNEWTFNHFIRSVTGIVIVTFTFIQFWVSLEEPESLPFSFFLFSIVLIYYGMIWATVLVAAHTSEHFFLHFMRKLSTIYGEYPEENLTLASRINMTRSIISMMYGKEGLHFAGIYVNYEQGLGVGSLIFSILIFAVHLADNELGR